MDGPVTASVHRFSQSAHCPRYPSTTDQVAALLGIKRPTLSAYIARGQLGFPEHDSMIGNTKLWKRSTIEEWQARRPRKRPS
jgi:excisionase family DNA binding protein